MIPRTRLMLRKYALCVEVLSLAAFTAALAAVLAFLGLLSGALGLGFLFVFAVFLSAAFLALR